MFLYYKACRKCDDAEKRGKESEENEYPKNFEGSSRIMEASAILQIVDDELYNRFLIIYVIISNDESTIQAVLKNPSKGARVQVMKSSKGKIDEEISEPNFLE